jgi:hypothetical protein
MEYCNDLSPDSKSICARGESYVFHRENASSLRFDISGLKSASAKAVALDAKSGRFHDLGEFSRDRTSWSAPGSSTWVLAIGDFPSSSSSPSEPAPALTAPTDLRIVEE